jgi:hypothetical protein
MYVKERGRNSNKGIVKIGLSKNQTCIYTGIQGDGSNFFIRVEGASKPTNSRTEEVLEKTLDLSLITKINSDGELTYIAFAKKQGIERHSKNKNPALF